MKKHYSKEELELYRNRQMSLLGRINCSAHLKECRKCAKLLQELTEEDQFIRELRISVKIFSGSSGHQKQSASR